MKQFYTSVKRLGFTGELGNTLGVRGVTASGKRFTKHVQYRPSLWYPVGMHKKWDELYNTEQWHDMRGQRMARVVEKGINTTQYKLKHNDLDLQGLNRPVISYINGSYFIPYDNADLEYDIEKINTVTIDIETDSSDGFPYPREAAREVLSITVKSSLSDTYVVWGHGNSKYSVESTINDDLKIQYFHCKDEVNLFEQFLDWWEADYPDIITGWNSGGYDMPYIVNRLKRLNDYNIPPERLSPYKFVQSDYMNSEAVEIVGIEQLDYIDIFKKFANQYGAQESYKLNHVAYVVLGEKKISYEEHGSLDALYKNDYQKFIDYNIKDVHLVVRMEEKLGLIAIAVSMAYRAGVNYSDTLGTTVMWDSILYRTLYANNICVPTVKNHPRVQFEGGYVKEPIPAMYDSVVSFDLNSLYPSIIMQYNMSPETINNNRNTNQNIDVDTILNTPAIVKNDPEQATCVAATGQCFNTGIRGVVPALVEEMYADRVRIKSEMLQLKDAIEKSSTPALVKLAQRLDNEQMTLKLLLNSLYGAIGNRFFRYFDLRIARAVTVTGQLTIKWAENVLNKRLNQACQTSGVDYIVAIDTDSLYVNMHPLLKAATGDNPPADTVSWLSGASEKLEEWLAEGYDELFTVLGGSENKMVMKREVIANKGIWTAKKRYILNVHDNEGVRYAQPRLKIMGIEAIKSSTPEKCRDALKDVFKVIIDKDKHEVVDYINNFKANFMGFTAEEVSSPKGVSNIKKWIHSQDDAAADNTLLADILGSSEAFASAVPYKSGTPIHVRGSILHNNMCDDLGLINQRIGAAEKIKYTYLTMPNPIDENVISYIDFLPEEFGLHQYVDYELQFEKTFLQAIQPVLDACHINVNSII
ncbi:MAG TPA: DNA polymerase [Flavobacteriales bacterium]|nr:DNA polymerase [Flavobacteriales bacterium]